MKKHLLISMALMVELIGMAPGTPAKSGTVSGPVKVAIAKYKAGNYSGCIQYCESIVKKDPSNAVAYYYMAISYVQAGKKDEAINAYSKVLALNPNPKLGEYATTGKRCIETPEACHPAEPASNLSGAESFINSNQGLSNSVQKDFQQKQLDKVKNEINSGSYLDKGSSIETKEPIAQAKPTNDEIAAALKVLSNAGFNPYTQNQTVNPYMQASETNPEMAQLSMLMGNGTQQTNNSSMMNMLPFMMAQNKNGTSNYSHQMMQSVIMNSMIPNMNIGLDDKDK